MNASSPSTPWACLLLGAWLGIGSLLASSLVVAAEPKLAEQASPAAKLPELAFPPSIAPLEWVRPPLAQKTALPAPLPPAEHYRAPLVLPLERRTSWRTWPALDKPNLASADVPMPPRPVTLAVGPKAFVAAVDPNRVPDLAISAKPFEAPLAASDDVTSAAARQLLVQPQYATKTYPPILILESVPDPFSHIPGVQLATPPADADPPAVSRERPTRPMMPVKTPPKK